MSGIEGEPISDGHGTAERGIGAGNGTNIGTGEGANVGGVGPNVTAGNVSAGSGDNSFEVIPPQYASPPGLSERQRAEFDRANQVPVSSSPSNNGDDSASEATMAMLKMVQRQMEMQHAQAQQQMEMMMKMMEERRRKDDDDQGELKEKTKWRGVKLDIKHFSLALQCQHGYRDD